jgi:hypothetical protein
MYRRVAIRLVVGLSAGALLAGCLGGCASSQQQSLVVASQDAPAVSPYSAAQNPAAEYSSLQNQQAAVIPRSPPASTGSIPVQPAAQTPPQGAPSQMAPSAADQAMIRQLIATSRMSYAGTCACPYDTDKAGTCGDRSAYARGKRNRPLCYPADVTAEMIDRQRRGDAALAHGTN